MMAKIKADLVIYVDGERKLLGVCEISAASGSIWNPMTILGEDALEELGFQLDIRAEGRTYEAVIARIEDVSSSGDGESALA
jgi:hypothetical protein